MASIIKTCRINDRQDVKTGGFADLYLLVNLLQLLVLNLWGYNCVVILTIMYNS